MSWRARFYVPPFCLRCWIFMYGNSFENILFLAIFSQGIYYFAITTSPQLLWNCAQTVLLFCCLAHYVAPMTSFFLMCPLRTHNFVIFFEALSIEIFSIGLFCWKDECLNLSKMHLDFSPAILKITIFSSEVNLIRKKLNLKASALCV